MSFCIRVGKRMRIEGQNPYYNTGLNASRQPVKITLTVTPAAAWQPQPADEAADSFKTKPQSQYEQLPAQLEVFGEQMQGEKDKLKIMLACMEIARRISGGDTIPPDDHKFLMKHDFALYARSILHRFPKNNPHEYKRLSWDDGCQDGLTAAALKQSFSNALESCRSLNNTLAQGVVSALGS